MDQKGFDEYQMAKALSDKELEEKSQKKKFSLESIQFSIVFLAVLGLIFLFLTGRDFIQINAEGMQPALFWKTLFHSACVIFALIAIFKSMMKSSGQNNH